MRLRSNASCRCSFRTTATALAGCAFAAVAAAGEVTIVPLVLELDPVAGVGLIMRIDNLAVNNNGQWMVEADTDNTKTDSDTVVIRDGSVYLREGDPTEPKPATIAAFDAFNLNINGNNGWNLFLSNTIIPNNDSGVFFKTVLLIQEGDFSIAPEFSPMTTYLGWFDAQINDNDDMLIMASVDDPGIAGGLERAIVFLDIDSGGELTSETVIAKEGDLLPGQTELVVDFQTGPHDFALNDNGDVMFIADLAGATATDDVIYVNDTLIAQQGSLSPIDGRNYGTLSSGVVDLSNNGDWVFRGTLEGDAATNTVIISNNMKVVQEGDPVSTARGTFHFTSFGSGPVSIDDDGNVLWFGDWDDPATDFDTGLFLNNRLLVQEGVSTAAGVVIDTINGIESSHAFSPNGRYVLFEGVLIDGREGAFMIDLLAAPPCPADLTNSTGGGPDGQVNVFDLFVLLSNWNMNGPGADLAPPTNTVDVFDLFVMLGAWGDC